MKKKKKDKKVEEKVTSTNQTTEVINGTPNPASTPTAQPAPTTQNTQTTPAAPTSTPNPKPQVSFQKQADEVSIIKTEDDKNGKGSVVLGHIKDGVVTPTNYALPHKINPFVKQEEPKVVSNKKQVRIVTPREKRMRTIMSLVVLLALAFCGGVYYYVAVVNDPQNYTIKNVTYNLGETVSTNSQDYVNKKNIDELQYVLNIDNVKADTIGTYNYTITYRGEVKTGTISIVDTLGPVLTPKEDIIIKVNAPFNIDNFITECKDPSGCEYKFETEPDVSVEGNYVANIVAVDSLGNTTILPINFQVGSLTVTLVCRSTFRNNETLSSREITTDTAYFNVDTLEFDHLVRTINNVFTKQADYQNFKSRNQNNPNYKFNDMNFSYSYDTEFRTNNNYTNLDSAKSYYESNGYNCEQK